MRINLTMQKKDDSEKDFWSNLVKETGHKEELIKLASSVSIERPTEIVKEGLTISYKPSGEYTIKLGHRADIVVTGIAKQEKDLQKQIRNVLAYMKDTSPKIAAELNKIEAEKRNVLVYKDIDRCRDCVWYESDTSHETYRDKCKNCTFATLGGELNNFFPRSQQMVIFTPNWHQVGDVSPDIEKEKKAFQNSLSLLDAHRKGQQEDRNPEMIADDIIDLVVIKPTPQIDATSLGTEMFRYFETNKLNFHKYGKSVIDHIENKTGITIHISDGNKTVLAIDKKLPKKELREKILETYRKYQDQDLDSEDAATKTAEELNMDAEQVRHGLAYCDSRFPEYWVKKQGEIQFKKDEKSASVRLAKEKEDKVVGQMSKYNQEELDKYEKVKDNYPESKEIMPKDINIESPKLSDVKGISNFKGTLCIAEVK